MASEEMALLGTSLMPGPAVDRAIEMKTKDLEKATKGLFLLHAKDTCWFLLQNILSVPRLLYCMGTNAWVVVFERGVSAMLNVELDYDPWA